MFILFDRIVSYYFEIMKYILYILYDIIVICMLYDDIKIIMIFVRE